MLLHFLVFLFYILTFSTLTESSLIILASSFLAQDALITGLMVYFLLPERSCYIIFFFSWHHLFNWLYQCSFATFHQFSQAGKGHTVFHLCSNELGYRGQVGLAYLRASHGWGNMIEYYGTKGWSNPWCP